MLRKEYVLIVNDSKGLNKILHCSESREECCDALNKYVREILRKALENKYDVDLVTDRHDRYKAILSSKKESIDVTIYVSE